MSLLTTLPCASEQSRMEITYPKPCRVCQILWQDIRLMAFIMLFYFYCAGSQANEGHGIFCWCFTYRCFSPKYNALLKKKELLFDWPQENYSSRPKSGCNTQCQQRVSWAKSYVDFSENIMIGLMPCCFLSLWGAPGSYLQAFLPVQEGEKPTVQRQKLRFVCFQHGSFLEGTLGQVPGCPGCSAGIHAGGRAGSSRVQPWRGWAEQLVYNKMTPQPLWKMRCMSGICQCLGWGLSQHFPLPAFGNLSRRKSLMPTLSPCLFRAGLLLLLCQHPQSSGPFVIEELIEIVLNSFKMPRVTYLAQVGHTASELALIHETASVQCFKN